jgi:hypothetical protein
MPRVLNKRTATNEELANAVYVGRPSAWGNPYRIGPDGNRKQVIEKFRAYVAKLSNKQREHWLRTLRGKDLVCWCAPKACHADVLLEIVNQ